MPEFTPVIPGIVDIAQQGSRENRAKAVVETFTTSAPLQTALKLHWYNFFTRNPNPSEAALDQQGNATLHLTQIESQRQRSALVPIGTELEGKFSEESRATLKALGIPCKEQLSPEGKHINLWEIASLPSYAAETQNVILQQLVQAGIAPRIPGLGAHELTDGTEKRLSLHINLGIPADINSMRLRTIYSPAVELLNDVLTLGYTSADRIAQRKTQESWDIKTASQVPGKTGLSPFRLELRAGELTDHLTYDMLYAVQRLATCMFQDIRRQEGKTLTAQETALAQTWEQFSASMKLYTENRHIQHNFADNQQAADRVFAEAEAAGTQEQVRGYIRLAATRAEKIAA